VLAGLGHMLHYAALEQIVSAVASADTAFEAARGSEPGEAWLAA
jgi:hypothetical protein